MKTILLSALIIFSLNFMGYSKVLCQVRETPRDLTIAFELNSGFRDSKQIVNPVFTGSARLYMEMAYLKNIARVAPFIGAAFENPGGSFELGIRNDLRLLKIEASNLPLAEIRAGISYFYSFKDKVSAIGADIKFEAADLIFTGLRFNKILKGSDYVIHGNMGFNF